MKTRINERSSGSSLPSKFACFLCATASWKIRVAIAIPLWLLTCTVALGQSIDTTYVTIVHPDGTKTYYSLPASPTDCNRGAALQTAKAAANSGDTIVVGPGEATTNNLLKDGVNWHFLAGATVIGTCCSGQTGCNSGIIFTDQGTPVNCIISGAGQFQSASSGFASVLALTGYSNIFFTADSMVGYSYAIFNRKATLHVKANTIVGSSVGYNDPAVWWYSGSLHIEAHEIISNGVVIQSNAAADANTGGEYLWVQANLIKTTSLDPSTATILVVDVNSDAREWIQALQILGPIAIKKSANTTGLTYVRAEKIFGQITQEAGNTGTLYVDAMKISPYPESGSQLNDNLIKLSGSNSWINISQIDDLNLEDSTHSPAVVAVTAGTHYLRGSSLARKSTSAGDGIDVTGGTLTVNGLAVSTSTTVPPSYDLLQSGTGTLKVLDCGYSLKKTSGTITEGNPKTGILGTAAFEALSATPIETYGIFKGIISSAHQLGNKGQYQVSFGRTEPDTNYLVTAMAESASGKGTFYFWSNKSTTGFVLNLIDFGSGGTANQDGVRITVSRIP